MEITLSLKDVCLLLLFIALLILIIYLIVFVKNAITSIKKANKMLDDVSEITGLANERVQDIDSVVIGVTQSVKNNEGIIKSATSIGKGVSSIAKMVKKEETGEDIEAAIKKGRKFKIRKK